MCEALAADGRGTPLVRAAATDPRALERLVRSAFRHNARYYLEVARTPAVTRAWLDERLALDTPELIAEAVVPGKAVLFVGLHFGSVELPVLFLAFRVGATVTPMETIDDPGLQTWFERTRGVNGVQLVGLREARRVLQDALRNGTPVGLVGDRDLTGGGVPIPLFGFPATMPMGPAMLAVESGVPVYGMTVRRTGHGRVCRPAGPGDRPGRRLAPRARHRDDDRPRRRVRTAHRGRPGPVVGGLLPDLAGPGGGGVSAGGVSAGGMTDATERTGRADLHIHTVASDGTASVTAVLERAVDLGPRCHRDHGP